MTAPDPDNPLDLYSSRELVDELAKRSDGLVILTLNALSPDEEGFNMWFRGGRIIALGLLERGKFGLLNKQDQGVE
jgi:hypothetical protein